LTAEKETKRVNPTEKETQKNGGLFFDAVVSESELEAAPFVGFADARPATRALENVVLETCSHRDDVAVSLGVSALDACFFAAPPDEDEDVRNPEGNPEGDAARFWTVFKREDAPVLARWLALRGSALDEPCLAFEAQREARETAAALAAAARAARALADVDPSAVSDAAEAEAAAADAKQAAERAAFDAFDAVAGVSPRLAASALRQAGRVRSGRRRPGAPAEGRGRDARVAEHRATPGRDVFRTRGVSPLRGRESRAFRRAALFPLRRVRFARAAYGAPVAFFAERPPRARRRGERARGGGKRGDADGAARARNFKAEKEFGGGRRDQDGGRKKKKTAFS
jgi:hypothetical protein